MKPATRPRSAASSARLLVVDPQQASFADFGIADLPEFLNPGDALVQNDAATLPASLWASAELELRLMSREADESWLVLTLGRGDYHLPTELRGTPRRLQVGERLQFSTELSARVVSNNGESARCARIAFEQQGAEFWQALYRVARPIQYAYAEVPLELWDVQNAWVARPWAVECPSAGKPLRFETLFRAAARGVTMAYVTHAAGLSSTGDAALDARLPVAERYEISECCSASLRQVKARGGRVVAVGTSVTRALESGSSTGVLRAASSWTTLRLGPDSVLHTCDGLLTGLHDPGTSHFSLLEAFAPRRLLERSLRHAERSGYLQHEFGDSCLILGGALPDRTASERPREPEFRRAG